MTQAIYPAGVDYYAQTFMELGCTGNKIKKLSVEEARQTEAAILDEFHASGGGRRGETVTLDPRADSYGGALQSERQTHIAVTPHTIKKIAIDTMWEASRPLCPALISLSLTFIDRRHPELSATELIETGGCLPPTPAELPDFNWQMLTSRGW